MFANPDVFDGGVDGFVIGAGLKRLFGGALGFGIEGVDLGHAAAEPDVDAVLGLAFVGDGSVSLCRQSG